MSRANSYMQPRNLFHSKLKTFRIFFIAFYGIGLAGLAVPLTFRLFSTLIPLALLISSMGLIAFHSRQSVTKTTAVFLLIYGISFVTEAIGVNTGYIFGSYDYGSSLGPKIMETPLMIGLNWLLLVYLTSSVTEKWQVGNFLKVVSASGIMVLYDLVLEPVAPHLDMWHWNTDRVPLQNYIAWFFIAFVLNYLIKLFGIKTHNKLAGTILICQFAFFLGLFIIF